MADHDCTCKTPVEHGSVLDNYTRGVGEVLSARVDEGLARSLNRYCSTNRCTQSAAIRTALARLSANKTDPGATLEAVRAALGLLKDASQEAIGTAIGALFAIVGEPEPEADPTAESPDVAALSKSELAACRKINLDPAEYISRKANAVRRA